MNLREAQRKAHLAQFSKHGVEGTLFRGDSVIGKIDIMEDSELEELNAGDFSFDVEHLFFLCWAEQVPAEYKNLIIELDTGERYTIKLKRPSGLLAELKVSKC